MGTEIKPQVPGTEPPASGQTGHCYKGVDAGAIITKIVEVKNGGKIILFSSGDKVIVLPGKPIRTEKPDGRVFVEQANGRVIESRIRSLIPLDEKPLNVSSGAAEPIGKLLSNFAERPFVMDGARYASVEAFYQGLKWPELAKRAKIAGLCGKEAKYSARGAPKAETFEYEEKTYRFGGEEHHQLIKRAIRESLEQNPAIRDQFMETHPRPIEHKTGRPENPNSSFPGCIFTRILTELRVEFMRPTESS
jgi:predicted NAD-dependent protein-ADP-ribosyltransferase YbiA (DUF1768 family)